MSAEANAEDGPRLVERELGLRENERAQVSRRRRALGKIEAAVQALCGSQRALERTTGAGSRS
jgi:hypothetical protein